MIRRTGRKLWKLIGTPGVLFLGVLLLAASAVSGNVFQNLDRSSLKEDNHELKDEIQSLKRGNGKLQAQLDNVKGEQECRSQIASESELIAGRLLAGVGKLLTVTSKPEREAAYAAIAAATLALEPALIARQESVTSCAGKEAAAPNAPTPTTAVVPTTAATVISRARKPTTSTSRPTSTTGTTVPTTQRHPSPTPTTRAPTPVCDLLPPMVTLPKDIPCL